MKVWQIATGETGRDYRRLFFDHDLMILGPSHLGDARNGAYAGGQPNSSNSQVHSFCSGPKPGDRVLMRFGKEVIGVGQIPKGDDQYSFREEFLCVYGWDLSHTRRVVWAEEPDLQPLIGVYEKAKQKPSFTQVHEKHIVTPANDVPHASSSAS